MPATSRAGGPAAESGVLAQANRFAQRHARAIFFGSALVVVVTVLLVANHLWQAKRVENGLAEISRTLAARHLAELKPRYEGVPQVHPRLLVELAERYYLEGDVAKARETYLEFQSLYPDHFLAPAAKQGLASVDADIRFRHEEREGVVKAHTLSAHPAARPSAGDRSVGFGPALERRPGIEVETPVGERLREQGGVTFAVELFEDVAPNAVAHLVELVGGKYFDGVGWLVSPEGDRITTAPRAPNQFEGRLRREASSLPVLAGTVFMVPAPEEGLDEGGRFDVALRDLPDLTGRVTVVGEVVRGFADVPTLRSIDSIREIRILTKRDHEYKAESIPR